MSGYPDLYRVVTTFETACIEVSTPVDTHQYGEDISLPEGKQCVLVKDLELVWFCHTNVKHRFEESVYRNAFADFSEVGMLSAEILAVDELFTANQASNLIEYLRDEFDDQASTHELETPEFPFTAQEVGFSGMPVGGESGFWMLPDRPGYPLSFDVWGHYDLRKCETKKNIGEN